MDPFLNGGLVVFNLLIIAFVNSPSPVWRFLPYVRGLITGASATLSAFNVAAIIL